MRKFFQLIKISLFNLMFGKSSNTQKRKRTLIGFAILVAYVVGYFGFLFYSFAESAKAVGGDYKFIISYGGTMALMFVFISMIASSSNLIYKSKDNDLLLSMPIPKTTIVGSKVAGLMVMSYAIELLILLPALIIYFIFAGASALGILFSLIALIIFPIVPVALSILISSLFVSIFSRVKYKALFSTLGMFVFFGAVMYLVFSFEFATMGAAEAGGSASASGSIFLIDWFVRIIAYGNWQRLLILLGLSGLVGILCMIFVSKTFLVVYSLTKSNIASNKKVDIRASSQFWALVKKEARKFFTTPVWIFNNGFGLIILIGASIYLSIAKYDLTTLFALLGNSQVLLGFGFAVICSFCAGMSNTACVSISMEGHKLYLLRSMPIKDDNIILSKIVFNLLLTIPVILFSTILLGVVYDISFKAVMVSLVFSIMFMICTIVFGMWANLKFPKLDAQNDTMVVKQSLSSLLGTIVPTLVPFLVITLYFVAFWEILSFTIYAIIYLALLVVLTTIFASLIYKNKKAYFESM